MLFFLALLHDCVLFYTTFFLFTFFLMLKRGWCTHRIFLYLLCSCREPDSLFDYYIFFIVGFGAERALHCGVHLWLLLFFGFLLYSVRIYGSDLLDFLVITLDHRSKLQKR